MKNYYNVLGISENSNESEIKKAFRSLSLKFHPDKNGGKDERFKEIGEAYEILSDANKKREYDNNRRMGSRNMNHPFFGNGMPHGVPPDIFQSFFGPGMGHMNMGGPNVRVYRNRPQPPKPKKPDIIIQNINLDLNQAYLGNKAYHLKIQKRVQKDNEIQKEEESIYIEIPEGVDDNEHGMHGDVKLIFKINKDKEYIRDGLNLRMTKEISLKDALCGFTMNINFFNGKEYKISNSEGNIISPGFEKEVCGMGMKRSGQVGRLFIKFNIIFPKELNNESIEQLKLLL